VASRFSSRFENIARRRRRFAAAITIYKQVLKTSQLASHGDGIVSGFIGYRIWLLARHKPTSGKPPRSILIYEYVPLGSARRAVGIFDTRPAMRITENTPSRLRLRDRTLWISAVCFAAAAIFVVRFAFDRDQPAVLIPAALFAMFGLAFLRATDVTFDKIERVCAIRRLDVLRLTRIRLAFAEITEARVEIAPMPDNPAVPPCRLSLVTPSAVVPLTTGYEPSQQRYHAMRDAVLEAVLADGKRPAAPDPVRMLAKAGRIIDAVAMLRARDGLDLTTASKRVDELRKAQDP
jgi:hypothetical protein